MAAPIEERLERLEERVEELEATIGGRRDRQIGITIEEARARLGTPVKRSERTMAQLRTLLGSFEGPEDLSENMREYLRGERA